MRIIVATPFFVIGSIFMLITKFIVGKDFWDVFWSVDETKT